MLAWTRLWTEAGGEEREAWSMVLRRGESTRVRRQHEGRDADAGGQPVVWPSWAPSRSSLSGAGAGPGTRWPPILTKRFEQGGCKVHHGGFPGYSRVCSEVEDEPGQSHRVADNAYGSRRAMPRW